MFKRSGFVYREPSLPIQGLPVVHQDTFFAIKDTDSKSTKKKKRLYEKMERSRIPRSIKQVVIPETEEYALYGCDCCYCNLHRRVLCKMAAEDKYAKGKSNSSELAVAFDTQT
eukprot:NODE_208_length_12861_cov_0.800972.p11 type:complete len:113 gc:universal NODE_208_length_12861_cov_0.800972:10892-11230(+)